MQTTVTLHSVSNKDVQLCLIRYSVHVFNVNMDIYTEIFIYIVLVLPVLPALYDIIYSLSKYIHKIFHYFVKKKTTLATCVRKWILNSSFKVKLVVTSIYKTSFHRLSKSCFQFTTRRFKTKELKKINTSTWQALFFSCK